MHVLDDPAAALAAIRKKHPAKPQKLKDRVRQLMSVIEQARADNIDWKTIHAGLEDFGLTIDFQLLMNYVGHHRKAATADADAAQRGSGSAPLSGLPPTPGQASVSNGARLVSENVRRSAPGPEPPPAPTVAVPDGERTTSPSPDSSQIHSVETLGSKQPVVARRPK